MTNIILNSSVGIVYIYLIYIFFISKVEPKTILKVLRRPDIFLNTKPLYSPITVYRLEKEGKGPYRSNILKNTASLKKPSVATENPILHFKLAALFRFKKYHFCFWDIKQLKEWFSEEDLHILKQAGFKLHIYHSHEHYILQKQVMFRKDKSTILNIKPIDFIFNQQQKDMFSKR